MERAARLVGTSAEYDALLQEVFGKGRAGVPPAKGGILPPSAITHRTHGVTDPAARQQLRAETYVMVAQLYALTDAEFAHILSTFPLAACRT